jgi:hypothetical protein
MLVAGGIGYLIGGWQVAAMRNANDLSAAASVALRFPQDWGNASPVDAAVAYGALNASPATTAAAGAIGDVQLALLSPEPMIPQLSPHPQQPVIPQTATAEGGGSSSAFDASEPPPPAAAQSVSATKAAVVAARRRNANRPGYMLNDAQIASIKERLHLTPDQEPMWPAVEAALRNIAYTRAQETRGRGAPASTAQLAGVDPNAVQGLKSAAAPLIMSFNTEQKEEVRNLAHVMGLDQLAAQF